MPITDSQALKSIKTPINGKALKRAARDNDRQRFHAGPATDATDAGPYLDVLKEEVKAVLNNEEKYARFCSLIKLPLPSTRIIDKGADEYLKSFGAEDKFVEYVFSSDTLEGDATDYLDQIGFEDWLTKNLFNQCLRASAAVWIADLPAEINETGFAEPILMLREVGQLTDVFLDRRGKITAIIYPIAPARNQDGQVIAKRWAVIDDESFRVCVERSMGGDPFVQFTNPHDLSYCPAGWIWHDTMTPDQPIRIQSPLHAVFSDLDDLVVGSIFNKHADLYASFPIFRKYKSRCTYETPRGEPCQNGLINRLTTDEDDREVYTQIACPACSKAKPIGPGSVIEVPQPQGSDSPNLTDPAGFINAERDLLDYNVEKIEKIEQRIRENLTGDSNNVDQTKDAVNEDQVAARFEARKGILSYWASHLQKTHAEVLSALFALRYGASFINVAVDYGTEFHLLSPDQAIADYDAARKSGLPMYQLSLRRRRVDKLLAGANEGQMTRFDLLASLEPYPDLPLALVPIGSDAWELKANFSQYIARFERENITLDRFGRGTDPATRLSNILQTLYQYVQDGRKQREVPQPPDPAP